jgi:hypothetical protein
MLTSQQDAKEPARLNKVMPPTIGHGPYDSMEGLIAIDASGPPVAQVVGAGYAISNETGHIAIPSGPCSPSAGDRSGSWSPKPCGSRRWFNFRSG